MPDNVVMDLDLYWQQAVPIEEGDRADQFLIRRMNLPRPKGGLAVQRRAYKIRKHSFRRAVCGPCLGN